MNDLSFAEEQKPHLYQESSLNSVPSAGQTVQPFGCQQQYLKIEGLFATVITVIAVVASVGVVVKCGTVTEKIVLAHSTSCGYSRHVHQFLLYFQLQC